MSSILSTIPSSIIALLQLFSVFVGKLGKLGGRELDYPPSFILKLAYQFPAENPDVYLAVLAAVQLLPAIAAAAGPDYVVLVISRGVSPLLGDYMICNLNRAEAMTRLADAAAPPEVALIARPNEQRKYFP
jgi:hypothetical protein